MRKRNRKGPKPMEEMPPDPFLLHNQSKITKDAKNVLMESSGEHNMDRLEEGLTSWITPDKNNEPDQNVPKTSYSSFSQNMIRKKNIPFPKQFHVNRSRDNQSPQLYPKSSSVSNRLTMKRNTSQSYRSSSPSGFYDQIKSSDAIRNIRHQRHPTDNQKRGKIDRNSHLTELALLDYLYKHKRKSRMQKLLAERARQIQKNSKQKSQRKKQTRNISSMWELPARLCHN